MTKIYDSVHGFIHFDDIESKLIDSAPFQRLRYIHQLGITYMVYPGATHTRFEHSLGVMHVATQVYDRLLATFSHEESLYWRKILRCAALCHDLGHLPFSHVAEALLLGDKGHEFWTLKIIESAELKPIWSALQKEYPEKNVTADVLKISIGPKKLAQLHHPVVLTAWQQVVSEILTGDFFGADRIDYLLRDARSTGVAYGLFDSHQLIEMIRILSEPGSSTLKLGIEENGIESCEALLLARHFMHRRVYQYPTVKSYSFHLARFMKASFTDFDLESYLELTDNETLSLLAKAARTPKAAGHFDACAIFSRKYRYKAISLPKDHVLDVSSYPEGKFFIEISPKPSERMGLSFPVLKRNQTIVDASTISDIAIPPGPDGWLFLDPDFAFANPIV